MALTIAYMVGSASDHSLNRALAEAMIKEAPSDIEFVEAEIAHLPHYKAEFDEDYPQDATRLKEIIINADGLLIFTPEYNRGIPGVLKNALDFISRPWGSRPLKNKPVLLAGAAYGATGTAVAQAELRKIMSYFDVRLMTSAQLYVQMTFDDLGEGGKIVKPGIQDKLAAAIVEFADFVREQEAEQAAVNPKK